MTNTNTAASNLVARANRLLAAGEYLPGRPHFAAVIGAKLAEVARTAKPADDVARATVCERDADVRPRRRRRVVRGDPRVLLHRDHGASLPLGDAHPDRPPLVSPYLRLDALMMKLTEQELAATRIRVRVTEAELDACAAGIDAARRRDERDAAIARLEWARKDRSK